METVLNGTWFTGTNTLGSVVLLRYMALMSCGASGFWHHDRVDKHTETLTGLLFSCSQE